MSEELEVVAWMSPEKERLEFSLPDTVYGSHTTPLVRQSDADTIIAGKDAEIVRLTKENKALAESPSRSDRVRALLYGRKIDELQAIAQQAERIASLAQGYDGQVSAHNKSLDFVAQQAALIEKCEKALVSAIAWDKSRKFIIPYAIRDPIHASIAAIAAQKGGSA